METDHDEPPCCFYVKRLLLSAWVQPIYTPWQFLIFDYVHYIFWIVAS